MPTNIEEMREMRLYANGELLAEAQRFQEQIGNVMRQMDLLDVLHYRMDYATFEQTWHTFQLPHKLYYRREKFLKKIQNHEKTFAEQLVRQKQGMIEAIKRLKVEFEQLAQRGDLQSLEDTSQKYSELGFAIEERAHECGIINAREAILKWDQTDFSEVDKIYNNYQPYNRGSEIYFY